MTLTISENWIRDRVHLQHDIDNADDVRSLALPGTYHEKITHLGNSLLSFSRLKHLDLSRNALQSLDGLQHLGMLEKLNLYYNNIATLKELYKLRHNALLEEVDLRLNPVTKNEPDYRLFMVHMLPNLRKLDDRSIRDSERKAALMHFNTDQATELTEHSSQVRQVTADKQSVPRADYVKTLAKKTSALDDDDCEVLDLIARTGDLSLPQPITGSTASYPQAKAHTLSDIRQMEQTEAPGGMANSEPHSLSPPRRPTQPYSEAIPPHTQDEYGTQYVPHGYDINGIDPGSDSAEFDQLVGPQNSGTQPRTQSTTHPMSRQVPRGREKVQVQFADNVETRLHEGHDSNLRFADESKAYTAYTSRGHFTPHPGLSGSQKQGLQATVSLPPNQNIPKVPHEQNDDQSDSTSDSFSEPPPIQRTVNQAADKREESIPSQISDGGVDQQQFMEKFLNLVDRYWNGSKSLQRHAKFQSQAQTLVSNFLTGVTSISRQETDRLHEDVTRFSQENQSLRSQLASHRSSANHSAKAQVDHTKLQLSLEQAQQDVSALKHQLHLSIQENQRLQERLASTPADPLPPPPQPAPSNLNQQVNKEMINTLEKEVDSLQRDNVTLKLQLKHFTQLQELATMLQESHKSLVTTNDHLLKELDESKLQHAEEVKQLHWSYGELKRTMELTANSALGGSTGRSRMSGGENGIKLNGGI